MKELKNFSAQCSKNDMTDSELLDSVVGKYKNKNEEELVEELDRAVKKAKEDGSYNEESLEEFYELVSPHLDDAQRKRLQSLITLIRSE